MTARRELRFAALAAVVVAAWSAGPAHAATAGVSPSFGLQTLHYRAGPGEANRLTVTAAGRAIALSDPAGIAPQTGCTRPAPGDVTRAVCALPQFLTSLPMEATLADGDDVVTAQLPSVVDFAEIAAGAGDDVIRGGAGEDRLDGGPGTDELYGFARDDTFLTANLDGSDTMHGGDGIGDEADYSSRRAPLRLDLDGRADDGQRGERDRIDTDVEDLAGGAGPDRIVSYGQPSTMSGGRGNDVMSGGRHTDELFGNQGRDRLNAGAGSDKVEGGQGSDRITGARGSDLLRGEGGDDLVLSRDGAIDRVGCGRGRDRVVPDRLDMAFRSCERVSRNGPAVVAPIGVEALPHGFALFASELEGRTVDVELGCPRDHRLGCAGSFRLVRRGRIIASRRFSLRTGARKTYVVSVPASTARAVNRRGRLDLRLVALSRDSFGRPIRLSAPFRIYETLPTLS